VAYEGDIKQQARKKAFYLVQVYVRVFCDVGNDGVSGNPHSFMVPAFNQIGQACLQAQRLLEHPFRINQAYL
jgi:hypothetical protein